MLLAILRSYNNRLLPQSRLNKNFTCAPQFLVLFARHFNFNLLKMHGCLYCPGKAAASVIIVVSLPCTTYQCGAFIAL